MRASAKKKPRRLAAVPPNKMKRVRCANCVLCGGCGGLLLAPAPRKKSSRRKG